MTISGKPFDEIGAEDLNTLIEVGVPEGVLVEYKRDMYGGADANKKEFLKDLSSFANTSGGHLIIGMAETRGVASAISPIQGNPDQTLQRLENLVQAGIEPRIFGIQMKGVPFGGRGDVFVIRIPRSWNPPHRVSIQNTNRFYVRSSAGAHEVSVEELRVLFTKTASARDRLIAFRQERSSRINSGDAIVPLADVRGRLILHIAPLAAFTSEQQIDIALAQENGNTLLPLGQDDRTPRINFEGFCNVRGGDQCHGYTHIFRNGIIEATKIGIVRERDRQTLLPTTPLVGNVLQRVPMYLHALQNLEVSPPFSVMITLQGIYRALVATSDNQYDFYDLRLVDRDTLELPIQQINDYGSAASYKEALRPAFDALWNAVGEVNASEFLASFDDNGRRIAR